jgi:exo-beta-1,3-glucanase (GH17 family)|tara:strand:- start:710 stop:1006 length:297 start_codon:yes stop_codon:yes gene_type:complete
MDVINIAGQDIPINIVEEFGDERLAEYDSTHRCINIGKEVLKTKELFRSTLVHEIIHCALDLSGANYNMPVKTEEQIVMAVEALAVPAVVKVWGLLSD